MKNRRRRPGRQGLRGRPWKAPPASRPRECLSQHQACGTRERGHACRRPLPALLAASKSCGVGWGSQSSQTEGTHRHCAVRTRVLPRRPHRSVAIEPAGKTVPKKPLQEQQACRGDRAAHMPVPRAVSCAAQKHIRRERAPPRRRGWRAEPARAARRRGRPCRRKPRVLRLAG